MRGRRGTWVEDLGLEDVVRGDTETRELGDAGTRRNEDVGRERLRLGTWDVGTGGRNKQTTPDFYAEFV